MPLKSRIDSASFAGAFPGRTLKTALRPAARAAASSAGRSEMNRHRAGGLPSRSAMRAIALCLTLCADAGVEIRVDERRQIAERRRSEQQLLREHAPRRVNRNRDSAVVPAAQRIRDVGKHVAAQRSFLDNRAARSGLAALSVPAPYGPDPSAIVRNGLWRSSAPRRKILGPGRRCVTSRRIIPPVGAKALSDARRTRDDRHAHGRTTRGHVVRRETAPRARTRAASWSLRCRGGPRRARSRAA